MSFVLSEIDERLLLNSFSAYAGQDGTLKVDQLRNVLIALKKPYPHEYIDLLLEEQGLNYETHFTFDQFKNLCVCRPVDMTIRSKLIKAFQAFDYQRRGLVDIDDVASALTGLGNPLTVAEADMFRSLLEGRGSREVRYTLLADILMSYVAIMDRRREVNQQKEDQDRKQREVEEMKTQFAEEMRIAREEENNRKLQMEKERKVKIDEELMRGTYEGLELQKKLYLEKSYQCMHDHESDPVIRSRRESPGRFNYMDGGVMDQNNFSGQDGNDDLLSASDNRTRSFSQRDALYNTGGSTLASLYDRGMIPRPVVVHDMEIQTETNTN